MKVFGIGFHKTATTSLANALYTLGFNVTGYFGVNDPDIHMSALDRAIRLANRYDAAQDTPWPVLYKELDQRYPNSKFILTVRPPQLWISSVVKHFKDYRIPAHEWIYGVETASGNEEVYIRRYKAHNEEVKRYFQDRPQDLLVMDITKGDGWEQLCPFLDLDVPPFPFPTQNTANQKSRQLVKRSLRYLQRRFSAIRLSTGRVRMDTGVSSAFIRDILHYHYGAFENVWSGVNRISEAQFRQESPVFNRSIRDLITRQIEEERTWYQCLAAELEPGGLPGDLQDALTRDQIYESWKDNQMLIRQYVANLTDEVRSAKAPGREEYIWEVFVHIMNSGMDRRTRIRSILDQFDQGVEKHSFIKFFHGKSY